MFGEKLKLAGAALGVVLAIALLIVYSGNSSFEQKETVEGVTYETFQINGMPCVYVEKNKYTNYATGGPSCDWSKWRGER